MSTSKVPGIDQSGIVKKLLYLLLEVAFMISVYIVLTGATHLLSPVILELFHNKPKIHRLFLSILTSSLLLVFGCLETSGRLDNRFILVRIAKKIRLSEITWVGLIYVITSCVFAYSSYIRHHVFKSSFDFAIFSQAVWNTWHGHFLYSSIKGGICLLGDHISPILALLAPLYGLWNDSAVLLLFQAVVSASAIFPIYFIAKEVLSDRKLPIVFVICYALYLPVRNAVRFDFHPELLGEPMMLWAFYFILKNKLITTSIFLAAILTTKEIACAPVAMIGLYCWWFRKNRLFGIAWFIIAMTVFLIDIKMVAPYFSGSDYFYLGNYSTWKETGLKAFLSYMLQPSTFTYLKKIFLPLGFFSFFSPSTFLLTLPILTQNLSAAGPLSRSIFFQYTTYLTSFVFISAIYGFRNSTNWAFNLLKGSKHKIIKMEIYWLLSWSLLLTGVSEYHVIREYQKQDNAHLEYIRQYLKTIPSSISVRTHEFFAPHSYNRKELHIFENNHPREGGAEKALNSECVVLDRTLLGPSADDKIESLIAAKYIVYHEHDGFYDFRRTQPSQK
ncbi:MAG: hypothetical protein A3G33_06845 [Omnitrophica bacterium RIFCSPLOWO2_12_FULL_44_17]|uniref:DUF2079 domain-containing protein n=1 Tax=Candidatus Danuiimicrobium aquiferis TaxID=1801832 RepID=A0A1G1KYG3_9BACT|nr:MAG: hypothetical protein A3B72_07140 [Omnitrophica bacterium RIFCSPHIGHO2_02_FULL_45_28]OGW88385.1 MAG: hypothetical protein A3E74_05795 [Omnitrophica bacterium RIFCSPHIGHO2_12_FULL_44_12]OGW97948.1 MAG: hypothetical protein A3G33_06845 [Omnitrophica bacterium RIFCSPLOWO2_12_FULL_44_17]OGX04221.1 MAG: hypothetical protein A3J12_11585 [Omnitrophica bacterium RIFCSPLOWO2_02_FULL_44_11]